MAKHHVARIQEHLTTLKGSMQYKDIRQAYLGKSGGTIPSEGLDEPFVWVRFSPDGEAVRAKCHKISRRAMDLPVSVGLNVLNGEWTVIEIITSDTGEADPFAATFSVPDRNPDYVYEEFDGNRWKNLHVEPGTDVFDVKVEAGLFWFQGELVDFAGDTINIAGSVPSGGFGGSKVGVLIGVDPADGSLTTFDGDVLGLLEEPGAQGKYFTEAYIADTVNAADPDIYWIALIPITSLDGDWDDLYRVTSLTMMQGSGASVSAGTVRVTVNDLTADYLSSKLVAGTGINLTVLNPGTTETLSVALDTTYTDGRYVNVTGDSMTGSLTIISPDPSLLIISTLTLSGADGSTHAGAYSTIGVNQNGFNLTATLGAVGLRGITSIAGASGTVTGAVGTLGQVVKSGAGTLTNAYSLYADTITKSAGTLTNAYSVFMATQTAGANNFGLYQGGVGLNLLNDQLSIIGSADRIQVIIKANATQTANLTEWQNSGGTVLTKVKADGAIHHGDATNYILLTKTTDLATNKYNIDNVQSSYTGLGLLRLSGTKSVTTTNSEIYRILDIVATHAVSSGQSSLLGEAINIDITGSGAGNITIMAGILSTVGYNGTGTVTSTYGFRSNSSIGSTGTVTDLYNFYVLNPTKGGSATLTRNYGLYVEGLTAGTNNWSIYTNAGLVHFGDNVEMADAKNFVFNTTTGTKIGTSTTQKLAFYNKTPIVQPAALTTQLTTLTCSAPGTPDYAIADPVASGFGFVTLDEALSLIKVIANLQTRFSELETNVIKALGLSA